ncbi:DUF5672 family protein [Polynucleobacter kasalickyi]|uniref:DUF5672 domain-containing protein n=1 Tax=Polynucleobacter kasalickyi TaxID=1938817 RepID=A0A1W1Y1M4_9BURK|nr:DUF5672 family protein [Polynucleobacter kasalickyi]SMC30089.1 hypothetical protein SAMN06296008_10125 [Polynucleobacter kasalickyi]
MIDLQQVTLFCVDTRYPDLSIWAMQRCLSQATFKDAILVTDPKRVTHCPPGIAIIEAPPIRSIEEYSLYLQSNLSSHISGTHMLVMQWDSFIVDPNLWDSRFLEYDYIGAPWPHHPETPVGNGGFSLRSKKLFEVIQNPQFKKSHPEDQSISIFNRSFLDKNTTIRFAPIELASQFAFERSGYHAFGFHGFFNFHLVLNDIELEQFIEMIPSDLLGKIDTYDLIQQLLIEDRCSLARQLLKKSSPKGKMWKKHLRYWILNIIKIGLQ